MSTLPNVSDYFFEHLFFVKFDLGGSWRDAVAIAAQFRRLPPPNVAVTPAIREWFLDDGMPVQHKGEPSG